jgi:hypothetical protein
MGCVPGEVQSRTLKFDKFCNGTHGSFWNFLTPPSCSEWQNTSKNELWGFSHDILGVANFLVKISVKIQCLTGSEGLIGDRQTLCLCYQPLRYWPISVHLFQGILHSSESVLPVPRLLGSGERTQGRTSDLPSSWDQVLAAAPHSRTTQLDKRTTSTHARQRGTLRNHVAFGDR